MQTQSPPYGGFCFYIRVWRDGISPHKNLFDYNSYVKNIYFPNRLRKLFHGDTKARNLLYLIFSLTLFCASCDIKVSQITPETPTAVMITSTLPATLTPPPSQTPPPPQPTTVPVEGIASTQINVRAEPSTVSNILGVIAANTKVQIVGRDPGENWWQILYPAGKDSKGWVRAQYVTTAANPEVPVIGGVGPNPNNGNVAVVQQQLNIRSGPGTSFNSLGTLNPQDVVSLTGKDANGAWLQIEFPAGPAGKGWVNAAFVQAQSVDQLPIVSDSGTVLGTGTPVDTPLPPTSTVVPALMDNDSAQAPAVNITFSATGTRSIQYTSAVSAPTGDTDDWIQFTSFTQSVWVELTCTGASTLSVEVLLNNQPLQSLICGSNQMLSTSKGMPYQVHIQATENPAFNYTQYILTVTSLP